VTIDSRGGRIDLPTELTHRGLDFILVNLESGGYRIKASVGIPMFQGACTVAGIANGSLKAHIA
jgi:hypothetical protein